MEIKVGTELYLSKRTGLYYVDLCKTPYTVIGVEPNNITIQEAFLLFNHERYYDTLPDMILANPYGGVLQLHQEGEDWVVQTGHSKKYATFGRYEYQPYLD